MQEFLSSSCNKFENVKSYNIHNTIKYTKLKEITIYSYYFPTPHLNIIIQSNDL